MHDRIIQHTEIELKQNLRPVRQGRLFGVVIGLIALWIGLQIPKYISVTMTPSLYHRVFFLRYHFDAVHQGEYVLFPASILSIPDKSMRQETMAIKRVGCSEGQRLQTVGLDFYCDNAFLGKAKTHSMKGTPVIPFSYNGLIPKSRYFVIGDNVNSFDSRYFGFLRKEDIHARAYPVF